jgi:hypothetical protein
MIKRLPTPLVAAVSAVLILAPTARADPSGAEQTYLTVLHEPSQYVTMPWPDDKTLVTQGHLICADMSGGDDTHRVAPLEAARLQNTTAFAAYPMGQIEYMMGAAQAALCPNIYLAH